MGGIVDSDELRDEVTKIETRSAIDVIAAVRFIFTVMAWATVLWWAKPLLSVAERFHQRWLVIAIRQIPNSLSIARIILSPIIGWYFIQGVVQTNQADAWYWLKIMAAVALLDGIDGPAARSLDAVSDFGKVIDPAADKVLFTVMLIGYNLSVLSLNGWLAFVPMIIITLWVARVEIALIQMPLQFKPLLDKLQIEHPGANIFGKIKFNLQMFGMFVGWILIIVDPHNPAGALWTVGLLFVARWFADKSLGRHRQELVWLYVLDSIACWRLVIQPRTFTLGSNEPPDNVFPIRKPA